MKHAKVRVAAENLQRQLWPTEEYRVRIVDAAFDRRGRTVVLTVEGEDLPDEEFIRPIVTTVTSVAFRAALPLRRPR